MTTKTTSRYRAPWAALVPLLAALGCGEDGGSSSGEAKAGPLYLLANEIYGADDSTTYVHLLTSLDSPELDSSQAIEFAGGRATVRTHAGAIFVAPPNSTIVEKYAVGEDGSLRKEDELGFGNYGFDSLYIDEWGNTFVSDTKAYLFNQAQGEVVVWNPSTMEIEGTVDHGGVSLLRDGWQVDSSPAIVRGDRLYRAFSWSNWDSYEWTPEVRLAVYDTTTDELVSFEEDIRCPALGNRPAVGDDGTIYFSNWIWYVGATLVSDVPASCVLRVLPGDDRFDPEWQLDYAELTEGRQGAMFAHLGGESGLISVFYDERVTIDDMTVGSELVSTPNWRLWNVDLAEGTATPLEGLEWNTGAISTYRIDERSFVFVPGADWSVTSVHEITGGRAAHGFDVPGWSYQLFRVR